MSEFDWVAFTPVLVALIASAPGAIALFLQMKRYKKEPQALDGDASDKYAQAAVGAAEYSITLQKRVTDLEAEKKCLRDRIQALEAENNALRSAQVLQDHRILELERLVSDLQAGV